LISAQVLLDFLEKRDHLHYGDSCKEGPRIKASMHSMMKRVLSTEYIDREHMLRKFELKDFICASLNEQTLNTENIILSGIDCTLLF
jgi:hypothetical protein